MLNLKQVKKQLKKYIKKKKTRGFTMIEVLVVLAITGMFSTLGAVTYQSSRARARDAERKSDLATIKVAFEDYYNDQNCYPPAGSLDVCGSTELSPYLSEVPCDPTLRTPYVYAPLADQCAGYRLHAKLEKADDPVVSELGCDGTDGCGYGRGYNYGVASGVAVYDPDNQNYTWTAPEPTPTPVASTGPGGGQTQYEYACAPGGQCNQYNLNESNCQYTFATAGQCETACAQNEQLYACN